MSTRHLENLLRPQSIAVIGADDPDSTVAQVLTRNLLTGGFKGRIVAVGAGTHLADWPAVCATVDDLPMEPDLAVVCSPVTQLPALAAALAARGTKSAVVVSSGPNRRGIDMAAATTRQLAEAVRPHRLRLIGPNSLGVMAPSRRLNASLSPIAPRAGRIAFVAQSGTIVTSVLGWAHDRGVGFSHLVSLGDMPDVDFGDLLNYLANDYETHAILLYIETLTEARKFMSAGRAAARTKPVLVVKAGRHVESAVALASHGVPSAVPDAVYDAAFRRAGMLRVLSLEELFDAVETLAMASPPSGPRLAIVANGGGVGMLATDAVVDIEGALAELSDDTKAALKRCGAQIGPNGTPVDLGSDANGTRYRLAIGAIADDKGVDGLLVINCPTAMASRDDAAQAVVDVFKGRRRPTALTSWVGDADANGPRRLFSEQRLPTYSTPDQAVRAFVHLVRYRRNQEMLMETPPSVPETFVPETARARATIAQALAEGRSWLTEPESLELLTSYAIPAVRTAVGRDPEDVAALAAEFGGDVAVKIVSPDIPNRSEVKGVALGVAGPMAARDAAIAMVARLGRTRPGARITGFTVQPMVRRPGAHELVAAITCDPLFGPIVLFGEGGTGTDVIDDNALALPPLNMHLAREVMSRTRVYRLLEGHRTFPAANIDAVALTLMKVAQLATDFSEITELAINPLLVDEYGVIALNSHVGVAPSTEPSTNRLAIRPYPKELEERIPVGDGRELLLRPVVPEDEPSLQAAFAKLSPEEIRLRFFAPIRALTHVMAARFTQIDYDREMALIVTEHGIPGKTELFGVVSIVTDADRETAEYALLVRGDMTGLGFGPVLMRRIIDYARGRGIGRIVGDVLRENESMLKLCKVLGFHQSNVPDDPSLVSVELDLTGRA
ncbi:MAG: bifunctional acetate--CoA ligase family protein/GNAT family N-acetyltransferase [Rhodospirillaceae bacterium]|nr:bifunctional acetate--CoA ligase family protein/GNAT family N-acetyltransferase [Rhodospirillaceae bacterium]